MRGLFLLLCALAFPVAVPAQGTSNPGNHELKSLNLSDTQIAQVLNLQEIARTKALQTRAHLRVLRAEIAENLLADPVDLNAVDALVDQAAQSAAELRKARVTTMIELRRVMGDDAYESYVAFSYRRLRPELGWLRVLGPSHVGGRAEMVESQGPQESVYANDFSRTGPMLPSHGQWRALNGRLYQEDTANHMAKINFAVRQSGIMQYTFNVRFERGLTGGKGGGFGIQVFIDKAFDGRSWGDGTSYLLWLNYDLHASYGPAGFRAELYRSTSRSRMVITRWSPPLDTSWLSAGNISEVFPVKIQVNGDSGDVTVWDPTHSGKAYTFNLGATPRSGNYVALRTNRLSVSFGDLRVTRIR